MDRNEAVEKFTRRQFIAEMNAIDKDPSLIEKHDIEYFQSLICFGNYIVKCSRPFDNINHYRNKIEKLSAIVREKERKQEEAEELRKAEKLKIGEGH